MTDQPNGLRPQRFMAPGGGGIEAHPAGLLYRRVDADAIIDGQRSALKTAKAEIDRLRAENDRLRAALWEIVETPGRRWQRKIARNALCEGEGKV